MEFLALAEDIAKSLVQAWMFRKKYKFVININRINLSQSYPQQQRTTKTDIN